VEYHTVDGRITTNAIDDLPKPLSFFLLGSRFDILNGLDDFMSFTLCPFTVSLILGCEAVAFALLP
jgi:hypothetical protein